MRNLHAAVYLVEPVHGVAAAGLYPVGIQLELGVRAKVVKQDVHAEHAVMTAEFEGVVVIDERQAVVVQLLGDFVGVLREAQEASAFSRYSAGIAPRPAYLQFHLW